MKSSIALFPRICYNSGSQCNLPPEGGRPLAGQQTTGKPRRHTDAELLRQLEADPDGGMGAIMAQFTAPSGMPPAVSYTHLTLPTILLV